MIRKRGTPRKETCILALIALEQFLLFSPPSALLPAFPLLENGQQELCGPRAECCPLSAISSCTVCCPALRPQGSASGTVLSTLPTWMAALSVACALTPFKPVCGKASFMTRACVYFFKKNQSISFVSTIKQKVLVAIKGYSLPACPAIFLKYDLLWP